VIYVDFSVVKAILKARYKIYIRYPGWMILNFTLPTFLTAMPLFLAIGITRSIEAANVIFSRYAGTTNFTFYILLGSVIWSISNSLLWDFGMWLYDEMEMGTLEQLFLTPSHSLELLLGSILYTLVISLINSIAGILIAAAILGCLHLVLNLKFLLALGVIAFGFIPLLGMSLVFGALVLRVKEPWAFFNFLSALLLYTSGTFYPITVLPITIRLLAALFPVTIQIAETRTIMLNVGYLFGPDIDFLLLTTYALVWPIFGLAMFERVRNEAQRRGSIGAY